RLQPLAVVIDPWRLADMERGVFTADVEYLFRKQVEEADVVVLSRADTAPPDVTGWVRSVRPDAAIVPFSGLTGEGLDRWLAARPARPAPPLDLDYDRYAAAEASLGWLNARVEVRSDEEFSPSEVLVRFLEELKDLPIAHAKVAVIEPPLGIAAVVRSGDPPRLEMPEAVPRVRAMRLLVNARVATSPEHLEARVRQALGRAARHAKVQWEELSCFSPARPMPEHRYAFRCGSGDDASCCADFYARPDVRYLLGDVLHPGDERLTLALAAELGLTAGARVLDVGCGRGGSLRAVIDRWSVEGTGIDAGAVPTDEEKLTIVCADAHAMPFEDASFDAVLCECALSTFADPARALAEVHRVLRPGGRLGMSDMIVEGSIPAALRPFAHVGACLAGARTDAGWQALLHGAGFTVDRAWDETSGLRDMVARIKRRLVGFALAKASGVAPVDVTIDVARGRELVREAERTLREGIVRYGAYIAGRRAQK
ncbi:MAG: DVU_1556 family methyltransferase, partial [Polyangiaceae bacterium]